MKAVIRVQYGNLLNYSWTFCTGQQLLPGRLWLQRVCGVLGRKCRAVHEELAWGAAHIGLTQPSCAGDGSRWFLHLAASQPIPCVPCSEQIAARWSVTRPSGDSWQLSLILARG